MKTITKQLIALGFLTWSMGTPLWGTHPATLSATPDKTPDRSASAAEKTKLQKAVNLVGAMTRGAMRGAVTGLTSRVTQSEDYTSDALGDMVAEFAQIPELADEVFVNIDETATAKVVEELTAAVMHTFILNEYHTDPLTKITRIVARLTQTLDIRTASKMRRYATLITRFLVESINTQMLHRCTSRSYSQQSARELSRSIFAWFRPVVGATAVLRTLLVEKIIDNRLAAKSIPDAQINRTRVVLNGTLGVAMNIGANWLNDRLMSLVCGKEFFDTHSITGIGFNSYTSRSGSTYTTDGHNTFKLAYDAPVKIDGSSYQFCHATKTFKKACSKRDTHCTTEQELRDYTILDAVFGQAPQRMHKKTLNIQFYNKTTQTWTDLWGAAQEIDGREYVFSNQSGTYFSGISDTHCTTAQELRDYEILQVAWNQAPQRRHKTTNVIEFYDANTQRWNVVEWQPTEIVDGIKIAFNNRTQTYFYQSDVANNTWTNTKSADKPRMTRTGNINGKQKGKFAGVEYFRDDEHSPWQKTWGTIETINGARYAFNHRTQTYFKQNQDTQQWEDTTSDKLP